MEPESRTPFFDAELAGHQDRTSIGNILAPARPLSPPLRAAKSGRAALAAPHVRTHRGVLLFISTSVSTTPGIARILAFIILLDIAPHFRACALSFSPALIASLCFFYGFVRVPVHANLGAQSRFAGSRAATASSFCSRHHGTVPQLPDFGRSRLCSPFELYCTCMKRNVI
jgi:hypothetical protein